MSTTTVAKTSLVSKLAEACDKVGGVEKKGRNENQRYNYVKAADVAKAIRHELFQRKVILLADEESIDQVLVKTQAGGVMRHLTLKVKYTLHDGESGETLSMVAFGVAMDSGDKAIYKAKTGALKYFLRGLGIIPDEKDDPEFDEGVDEATDQRLDQPARGKNAEKAKVKEYQVRAFNAASVKSGKTAQQVADYLRVRFKTATVADLMHTDFTEAIRWALGAPEALAENLETSLKAAQQKKRVQPITPEPVYVPDEDMAGD